MRHRPFVYMTGAWVAGIVFDHFVPFPFWMACLGILVLLILAAVFLKKEFAAAACLLLALACLGAVCAQNRKHAGEYDIKTVAGYYRKKPMSVKGAVISDVQEREAFGGRKTTFTLKVSAVKAPWGWQERTGKILVNVFQEAGVTYGDEIMAEGKLHRPYNFSSEKNFSYRGYLRNRGIGFILSVKKDTPVHVLRRGQGNAVKALSLRLRDKLKKTLSAYLSRNEAGIMKAILLGDRTDIPVSIRMLFVQTGTAHILAISGLHIGIVAALFLVLAKVLPIDRKGQLIIVIALLAAYAFLTGGRPSVVRATILAVVFLASFILEREFDAVNTLCLAAMIILLANPLNFFDVGFQLSFTCVFSIIFLNEKINGINRKSRAIMPLEPRVPFPQRFFSYVARSLCLSLAIWVGVAGLIAYYFAIITPVTILANLIVVPLISVVVVLGFGLLFTGTIMPFCAVMFASCLKLTLNMMAGSIYLCDKLPWAHIYLREVSLRHIAVYYAALFALMIIPWGRIDKPVRV